MKKLIIIVGVLAVVIVGLVIFGISNLGPIIKKGVNTYGPRITKTQMRLGDVNVSLFSGRASLKDFFLGNPQGFSSPQAVRVGSMLVDVDEKSLAGDTIVIDQIEVIGPEINYEKLPNTDNFQAILKNVKEATGQSQPSEKVPEKAETSSSGKKLLVRSFLLKGGKVTVTESLLTGRSVTVPLPDISLQNVGHNGAPPEKVAEEILAAIYKQVKSPAVAEAFQKELKNLGADLQKDLDKKLDQKIDQAESDLKKELEKTVGEDATKMLEEGTKKDLEEVKGKLKGLLDN